MLGYRERIKRHGRVERWFASRVLSVSKVEVVSDVASHGGTSFLYNFLLSRVN